jgi:hypothetical protein
MDFAGIKIPDTALVHDAMDLSRSLLEPFLFNDVMRFWLFGIVLAESAAIAPNAELLANGENRFEVDGANAAREFLKERGISAQQTQLVWDAIALLALHKEPEVVMTHSGIAVDVLGAGLDRISREKQQAILTAFPRLAFKDGFKGCLCNVVRQKPITAVDNILRDFGIRYVEGFTPPNFADLVAGAPFSE